MLLQLDAPFVAESPKCVTLTEPPQLSVALIAPGFGGGTCVKHCTLTASGQVIEGGVVSLTVIVWVWAASGLASVAPARRDNKTAA